MVLSVLVSCYLIFPHGLFRSTNRVLQSVLWLFVFTTLLLLYVQLSYLIRPQVTGLFPCHTVPHHLFLQPILLTSFGPRIDLRHPLLFSSVSSKPNSQCNQTDPTRRSLRLHNSESYSGVYETTSERNSMWWCSPISIQYYQSRSDLFLGRDVPSVVLCLRK